MFVVLLCLLCLCFVLCLCCVVLLCCVVVFVVLCLFCVVGGVVHGRDDEATNVVVGADGVVK